MNKLRKHFLWRGGTLEISIVGGDDGRPLDYVWFGTQKRAYEKPTIDFDLGPRQAVTLAKAILKAAKLKRAKSPA